MTLGTFNFQQVDISIGPEGAGGLSHSLLSRNGSWNNVSASPFPDLGSNDRYSGGSERFTYAGGVYTSAQGRPSTLTFNATTGIYTYTPGSGRVLTFDGNHTALNIGPATLGLLTTITDPDGTITTISYKYSATICVYGCGMTLYGARIQSVTTNTGYQLKYTYSNNDDSYNGYLIGFLPEALNPVSVTAVNNTIDYCDPASNDCAFTKSWPTVTYASAAIGSTQTGYTVTDALGRQTRYTVDNASQRIVKIKTPTSSTDNISINYNSSGHISSVVKDGKTWGYNYLVGGGLATMTVTDPLNHTKTYTSQIAVGRPYWVTDGAGKTTSIQYDGFARITRVTQPEGNYTSYAYDTRGNLTKQTQVSKTPGTPADIVISAGYDATCTNPKKCNKPNWAKDALGNQTDYSYDPAHGGVLSVTAPVPATGAVRPQTRYSYTALQAWYKNAAGTIVASGKPIAKLTGVSACQANASCAGTADEVKSTIAYGTTGVANNLLPASQSNGAGNGSLTATTAMAYDTIGNLLTVDGPLAGTADTTRYRYDAGRQLIGVTTPDPDGAGARLPRATRFAYNADGQVIAANLGTVTSQSDAAWAAFAVAQTLTTSYDALGRKVKEALSAGSTVHAVTQYSYDDANRLDCTAVRMNSATFAALPASACTAAATGAAGPDRIRRNSYDNADRLTSVTVAYGVSGQQHEDMTITYTGNGQQESVADGRNNLTTYEYDGFDRLLKTRYPSPTTAGSSSTTDYEEYSYNARDLTAVRRRDGQAIGFAYDNLGRLRVKDIPGGTANDVYYAYDNLGRLLSARYGSAGGSGVVAVWDALGRLLSQAIYGRQLSYQYDLAGRRTRLTYPDAVYVQYDTDMTGNMTAVRENGASSGAGVLALYAYDNLGRRTGLTRGNGTTTSYGYDAVSRLQSLSQDLAGTSVDLVRTFTFNPASQIQSQSSSNDAYAWTAHHNIDLSYTVNGLNQLTAAGATAFTHDTRGNLTSDGSNSYGYDVENRLTSISGGSSLSLAYDPLGRLYQLSGGTTTQMLYDGDALAAEYSSAGALQRRYVPGAAVDEVLVWYEGSGTSERRWLHTDERGSIIAVSDGAGNALSITGYGPYGVSKPATIGRFGYTGQARLGDTGLYYFKARIYAPALGRFLQTDPVGYDGGLNLYAYASADPINRSDPTGQTDIYVTAPHWEWSFSWSWTWNTSFDFGFLPQIPNFSINGAAGAAAQTRLVNLKPGAEATQEVPGNDIVVTARRTTLPNVLPSTLWYHFLDGSGDTVCLTASQFNTLASVGKRVGNLAPRAGGGYTQETSYYGGTYANSFGTATVYLNAGGNPVGFHDYYNFDAHDRSSLGAQAKTAIGALGYLVGGKDFSVDYNNGICR